MLFYKDYIDESGDFLRDDFPSPLGASALSQTSLRMLANKSEPRSNHTAVTSATQEELGGEVESDMDVKEVPEG